MYAFKKSSAHITLVLYVKNMCNALIDVEKCFNWSVECLMGSFPNPSLFSTSQWPPTSSQKLNLRKKEASQGRLKDRKIKYSRFLENDLRCGPKSRKCSRLLETKRSWTKYQKVFEVSFKYRTTVVNCAIKSLGEKIMDLAGRTWTSDILKRWLHLWQYYFCALRQIRQTSSTLKRKYDWYVLNY